MIWHASFSLYVNKPCAWAALGLKRAAPKVCVFSWDKLRFRGEQLCAVSVHQQKQDFRLVLENEKKNFTNLSE